MATGPDGFRTQASNRVEDYQYSDGTNTTFVGDEDMLADFGPAFLAVDRLINQVAQ